MSCGVMGSVRSMSPRSARIRVVPIGLSIVPVRMMSQSVPLACRFLISTSVAAYVWMISKSNVPPRSTSVLRNTTAGASSFGTPSSPPA